MSSVFYSVNTRINHATGYWGPVNANHQFCEPHYDVSHYIAEYYNTVSSGLYTILAIYCLLQEPQFRKDPYVFAAILCVAIIGLGSAAFHGTMRYHMQLCDELPMVFYVTCLLLGSTSRPFHHPLVPNEMMAKIWKFSIITMALAVCSAYVIFDQYEIFLHGFTAICIIEVAVETVSPFHSTMGKQQFFSRNMSIGFLILGRFFWEIEDRWCSDIPQVYPLHVVWHCCSCVSAYYGILALYLTRMVGEEEKHPNTLPNVWGLPPLKGKTL